MRTYGTLELTKDGWVIDNVEPHVSIKLKKIFPRIPRHQVPPYRFHCSPETSVDLEWFMVRYPLEMNNGHKEELISLANTFRESISANEKILLPGYKPRNDLEMKKPAREYQLIAADFYANVKRYLLGDEIGIGKTVSAIAAMLKFSKFPAAVVVQAHLSYQWKEKIEEFSNLKVHVIQKRSVYDLPEADVYIFRYSNISGWTDIINQGIFKQAVFDEIQELRKEDTAKYKSSEILCANAEAVMGLSGTPIYNYADELWNIMNLIKPYSLGSQSDFQREWGGKIVEDPKALGSFLRENHLFLRRTRKDVGNELPPVNKITHTVPYDEEAVEKEMDLVAQLAMVALHGSREEKFLASGELDLRMRHITGVSKAKYVAEYVKMLIEAGEKVLLAGWHRDVYEIWKKEFEASNVKYVMYTGSESSTQKNQSTKEFIEGNASVMIISLRSGVGLDGIQKVCNTVVIGELDYSPKVHDQVIGRAQRDGQEEPVLTVYLVSDGGSDPVLVNLLGIKSSQSDGIVDPFSSIQENFSDENRIKLMAQKVLESRKSKKKNDCYKIGVEQ